MLCINDNKVRISVVIPVYNVSKYIKRCLYSVLNQTYTNLEIILIDDGSNDGSSEICDEYNKIDNRIKVIHKENGGLSSARNCGLKYISGQYISFVDSDDMLCKNFYETMVYSATLYDADLVLCRFDKINEEDNIFDDVSINFNDIKTIDTSKALNLCLSCKKYSPSVWSKLYKRSVFNDIVFPKNVNMEDFAIVVDTFLLSKNVVLVPYKLYHYRVRKNSIMTNKFNLNDVNQEKIFVRNNNLVLKYFPKLFNQSRTNLTAHYFYVIDKLLFFSLDLEYNDIYNEYLKKLKNNCLFILFKSKHILFRKVSFIILLINKNIYKCILMSKKVFL